MRDLFKPIKSRGILALSILLVVLTGLFLSQVLGGYGAGSELQVTFIDVGQGDSFLIQDTTGFDVLIDGGKETAGPAVAAYLRQQQVDDIDVMMATHADADHIGGLIDVLEMADIPVQSVLYNGYPGGTDTWDRFIAAVASEGITLTVAQFPNVLTWGQMTAYVLNPAAGLTNPETNDASVVVLLAYGQNRLLFTGDIDSTVEATVVARGTPVAADVLKVAHHGSSTSSSSEFLAQVSPDAAVISVGEGNSYGHPAADTLARLNAVGARIYRTDYLGNIVFTCDGLACVTMQGNFIYLPAIFRQEAQATSGKVVITDIFFDGVGTGEADEYVEIQNVDSQVIQLQNWTLRDEAGKTFIFPVFGIQPNQTCRVYTNENHTEWCGFNYAFGSAIWNNGGDCAFLRDAQGTLVDGFCY